jgi:hypothetical protein
VKKEYTIAIGQEGLDYQDPERVCHFGLYWQTDRWILHAYQSFDENWTAHEMTADDREIVIPRIVEALQERGDKVYVLNQHPPQRVRSADDVLAVRFYGKRK